MLDRPPRESEVLSWVWVGLGITPIYSSIPLVRTLQSLVSEYLGREAFLYVCLSVLVVGSLLTLLTLRKRPMQQSAYWWLMVVFVGLGTSVFMLRSNPEEALHVKLDVRMNSIS